MMVFQILGFLLSAVVALFLFYIIVGFTYLFIRYVLPWAVLAVIAYALCGCAPVGNQAETKVNIMVTPESEAPDVMVVVSAVEEMIDWLGMEPVVWGDVDIRALSISEVQAECGGHFGCHRLGRIVAPAEHLPLILAHELGHLYYLRLTGDSDRDHTHTEWFDEKWGVVGRVRAILANSPAPAL